MQFINTLTRTKEDFKPMDAANVRMYVCGVTPYDDSHIGHARAYVVADVLFRLLRHTYGEDHVTYVRNFTDVDDKIIARANENGEAPAALAERFIKSFHDDVDALNCLRPTFEPRVTDPKVMQGIVDFIIKLEGKGAAYVIPEDGVYLDTTKIDGGAEYTYGQLSRKKMEDLVAGARVEANMNKRNSGDFALWKLAKPGEPFWASPWGDGRPGWHIECSVMSEQLLGERFDIHGGGEDLQFPHHENELAQSVACTGHIHANMWIHNAFITVNGIKMSKSLGNFTTIIDALRDYPKEAIRLWLLQSHYRKPADYSAKSFDSATGRLLNYMSIPQLQKFDVNNPNYQLIPQDFWDALEDDLNTSRALAVIDTTSDFQAKLNMLHFLGINIFYRGGDEVPPSQEVIDMLRERQEARLAKNWSKADDLRDQLRQFGYEQIDLPNGSTWKRI